MRIIIQRVKEASVVIDQKQYSSISSGLLCLVGFCNNDTEDDFVWAANKIFNLKLFKDEKSLEEIQGGILIVSQFTLLANTKKGNRPSFIKAAEPSLAKNLYDELIKKLKNYEINVEKGRFGAQMFLDFINDGPVTIIMDDKK